MKNLEQLRAANAVKYRNTSFKGADDGGVVKKVPTMIRENGFLGALAFALEQKINGKSEGHFKVFECIVEHLRSLNKISCQTPDDLMNWLVEQDSATLREVTTESLLYMNYLRRFAKPAKPAKSGKEE